MAKENSVRLIGYLGQEPKLVPSGSETIILSCTMATSSSFKNSKGERETKTTWHNLVGFGSVATLIEKFCKKGSKVMIEGHLQTRNYNDKHGVSRYTTEIVIEEVMFLDNIDKSDDSDKG